MTPVGDKASRSSASNSQFTLQASDGDQDALTFSALGLPAGATLTPSSVYGQAIVTWTPTASDAGIDTVVFQVTDDGNGGTGPILSDQQTMHIVVRASNAAPVLVPVGNQTVAEGQRSPSRCMPPTRTATTSPTRPPTCRLVPRWTRSPES